MREAEAEVFVSLGDFNGKAIGQVSKEQTDKRLHQECEKNQPIYK